MLALQWLFYISNWLLRLILILTTVEVGVDLSWSFLFLYALPGLAFDPKSFSSILRIVETGIGSRLSTAFLVRTNVDPFWFCSFWFPRVSQSPSWRIAGDYGPIRLLARGDGMLNRFSWIKRSAFLPYKPRRSLLENRQNVGERVCICDSNRAKKFFLFLGKLSISPTARPTPLTPRTTYCLVTDRRPDYPATSVGSIVHYITVRTFGGV